MYNSLCLWRLFIPFCFLAQIPITSSYAQGNMPCLSGVINQYTPVLGFGCDSSTLQVGNTGGFGSGDEVLLIQMQAPQVDLSNTPSFGTLLNNCCVGNYELNRVQSINGTTVQLQYAPTRTYDLSGKVQLVKVPEYDSAMVCGLSCMAWDGTVGGVLALDVKNQLVFNGDIDVSRKGFRGGRVEPLDIPWVFGEQQFFYPPQSTLAAEKGEGIAWIPVDYSYGRGRAANGGGGGNAHNGGGGGGANGGDGGNGGLEITNLPAAPTPNTDGIGGQAYFSNLPDRLIMGGGGGAGHANDTRGTSGGNGGGIVLLSAKSLVGNNRRILANGEDIFGGQEQNDGQGGGGGGGTILLNAIQVNGALRCELKGGEGGSNPYTPNYQLHGPGGGGGGGKFLSAVNFPNVLVDLQGGINGFTSQHLTNGAQPGAWGKSLFGAGIVKDTLPAHPVSTAMQLVTQSPGCFGINDGSISVVQSTALAFRLNGGPWQAGGMFSGLGPGVYHIGLQFSGGCTLDTVAQLSAPPPVLDSLLAISAADCVQGGFLGVTAVSGTAPFVYQIDGGNWQNSGIFQDLNTGAHTVAVQDANGCLHQSTYTIAGPVALQESLINVVAATCITQGMLEVSATGGVSPFEYRLDGGAWQGGGLFSGLSPGMYQVDIRDAQGCMENAVYTIPAPPVLLDTLLALTKATCSAGGTLEVATVSGSNPVEYQLDMGVWQASGSFSGLSQGVHELRIKDAAGCEIMRQIQVDLAELPSDTILALQDATCISGGSVQLEALSGVAPFGFNVDGGAWQTGGDFNNLPPGMHSFGLQDANGCIHLRDITIAAAPPVGLQLLQVAHADCSMPGALTLQATGGLAPFVYRLDNGNWQADGHFTGLPAGTYSIYVRDANGCVDSSGYTIIQAPPVQLQLNGVLPATCLQGAEASVTAVSGTPPFVFQLDGGLAQNNGMFTDIPPGLHLLWAVDAAACRDTVFLAIPAPPQVSDTLLYLFPATCIQGGALALQAVSGVFPFEYQLNNGAWQNTGVFTGLNPGAYQLRVRDANGCESSETYSIPAPATLSDSLIRLYPATCVLGGGIEVSGLGAAQPFEYRLNGGNWQASGVFPGLAPGQYQVLVRDSAGCVDTSLFTVQAPPTLGVSLLHLEAATCIAGGMITLGPLGGTPPFAYQVDGGNWQPGGVFSGLSGGTHAYAIRDSAGCISDGTGLIAVPPPLLDSLVLLQPAGCLEGGMISIEAISGTPPVSFQLGSAAPQATGVFEGLLPGNYQIQLLDAAFCTHSSTYNIPAPPLPTLRLDSLQRVDCRHAYGFLEITGSGGTAPLSYILMPSNIVQNNGRFEGLSSGVYEVLLRDSAGCETQPAQLYIPSKVDSFFTSETVTMLEGNVYHLPDGRSVTQSGQFLFRYQSVEGCDSLHLIDVQVKKRHVYIPNAIRPDDEGRNDYFTVFADDSLERVERLSVYDRWGELLFDKQDFMPNVEAIGWDGYFRGKPVNPGVFVWTVRLRFTDGLKLEYSGNLTVFR